MKTYLKTLIRTFKKHAARMVSIVLMVLVSVGFISGIGSAADKIAYSLTEFYTDSNVSDFILKDTSGDGFSTEEINSLRDMYGATCVNVGTSVDISYVPEEGEKKYFRLYFLDFDNWTVNTIIPSSVIEGKMPEDNSFALSERSDRKTEGIPVGTKIELDFAYVLKDLAEQDGKELDSSMLAMLDKLPKKEVEVSGVVQYPLTLGQDGEPSYANPEDVEIPDTNDALDSLISISGALYLSKQIIPTYLDLINADERYSGLPEALKERMLSQMNVSGGDRVLNDALDLYIAAPDRDKFSDFSAGYEEFVKGEKERINSLPRSSGEAPNGSPATAFTASTATTTLAPDGSATKANSTISTAEATASTAETTAEATTSTADTPEKGNTFGESVRIIDLYSNFSFHALHSYAEKVRLIGYVLMVAFLFVTALVVLSTVTRMLDEERAQIACLKTLGYSPFKILFKYLLFAAIATGVGGVFAYLIGSGVTSLLYWVFNFAFAMPPQSAFGSPAFFLITFFLIVVATLAATSFAGIKLLREAPAELLRPKPPKSGKKVIIEKIPFIWNRLSFKYKSTVRNVLRYKSRFFMTVISVAISMALVMGGLALLDICLFRGVSSLSILIVSLVIVAFAGLLTAVVIYTLTNINISERERELATLMVLGYHNYEVAGYIYREIYIDTAIGIIFGFPLAALIMYFLFAIMGVGTYATFMWAVAPFVVLLFTAVVTLLLRRKITRIHMNESLKAIE